jgi:hypothetical protein
MHDYAEYDNLWRDLKNLEKYESKIIAKFYYDDLIVVFCGNYLKFAKYKIVQEKNGEHKHIFDTVNGQILHDVNLTFSHDT